MTNFQATDADLGVEVNNADTTWPALQGRLHTAVRILWIGWAIVALGIFVTSLPAYLGGIVPHSANAEAAGQSTLVTQSLDAASAIASITAAIISLGLATLLFLRKSNDGMAMFVSFLMQR